MVIEMQIKIKLYKKGPGFSKYIYILQYTFEYSVW